MTPARSQPRIDEAELILLDHLADSLDEQIERHIKATRKRQQDGEYCDLIAAQNIRSRRETTVAALRQLIEFARSGYLEGSRYSDVG